jgi:inner membrane protein
MQKSLLIKAALVGLLFFVVLIPLQMIGGLVAERASRQRDVVQEIAASSFGRQTFAGPILIVPYSEEYDETLSEEKKDKTVTRVVHRRIDGYAPFFPASADIAAKTMVGTKYRGLFKARVFNWQASVHGEFVFDGKFQFARTREGSRIALGKPFVAVALGDPRGLSASTVFRWQGDPVALERGTNLPQLSEGVHVAIPGFDPTKPQRFEYALGIGLQGTESIAVVPLADATRMRLASDWPHPSFAGQFLPLPETKIGRGGFEAVWSVSGIASAAQAQLAAAIDARKECRDVACADQLAVRFIEPIDIYSLSDRALKYAFLFVALTFAAFFAFEVLRRLRVHPAQYFLVGLALATFFLLLIALSEHIAFVWAYALAACACVLLLGFYLSAVLHSAARGGGFAAVLGLLYAALYGLLISEDNSLLLGSLLIFALVAAALIATRKLDWYTLGSPAPMPEFKL